VENDAFSSAVLLLQVIHNKKVSNFSTRYFTVRDTAACLLFTTIVQIMLHFKKTNSDLSDIRALLGGKTRPP